MTSDQWLVKAVKSGKDGRTEEWKRLSWVLWGSTQPASLVDWPVNLTRGGGQGISIDQLTEQGRR